MIRNDLILALPEVFLALAAIALLMVGVFRGQDRSTRMVLLLCALAGLLTLAILVLSPREAGRTLAFDGLFVVDAFGDYMKIFVLIGAVMTILMSLSYILREEMARFEIPVLMLFATLGMMMMISANDLISLYVGLELQSLALYVLAAVRRDNLRSSEAGLKYFVLGALSSGMLLYGCSLIYGFTGTTSFPALANEFTGMGGEVSIGLLFGIVFLIAGLAFKVSAVPFHMWTPDVYEGAPTPITAFFANAPKIAAMGLFVRVMIDGFGDLVSQWQQIIVAISMASMVLGALAAISQTNIKRLMAYSSIGHVGYALIGLAAGSETGIRGLAVYMGIYLVMNIGTFACILCMRQKMRMVEGIEDLAGLGKSQPGLALALGIFMFSMAGIPPLAGFFGKLYVFQAAIEAQLYTLAVVGVLSSVVGAFYYLRIVKIMYFDEPVEVFDQPVEREVGVILTAAAAAILLFFIYPAPILEGAQAAAASLFAG